MKPKIKLTVLLLLVLTMLCSLVCLSACKQDNRPPEAQKYQVAYEANGGTGTAPAENRYEAGTKITLAANPFAREGYEFDGWLLGETVYAAGAEYTVPESDSMFKAKWKEATSAEIPHPAFLQAEYAYDRWGGGVAEMTLDLDGANLFYVEIDGNQLYSSQYSYNSEKGTLEIAETVALALADGNHTVRVVTDSEDTTAVTCTLKVDNSIRTSFDETTTKNFTYGVDDGVTFAVNYSETDVVSLKYGAITVDPKYYTVGNNTFTLRSDWLKHFNDETEYLLTLSNNDSYTFTVMPTNIKFASDYDLHTIHNTTASNDGQNPLYQYYDNVAIVDAPQGMEGKVLQITPNTTEVLYDCNGYITLRHDDHTGTTWYNGGFVNGKYYVISFDYMTEGTSVGTFCYKDPYSGWKRDLLLGAENDGVVHHFFATVAGDELIHGLYLYAYFAGGGGKVYVDNFFIAEFDELPTVSATSEYALGSGDYAFAFYPNGFGYTGVRLDGTALSEEDWSYSDTAHTVTIAGNALRDIATGKHTVTVVTAIGEFSADFDAVDNRVAELTETTKNVYYGMGDVKIAGNFDSTLNVTSVTRQGSDDSWDATYTTPGALKTSYVTLEEDGLVLSGTLINELYGTTTIAVSFDNGKTVSFELVSNVRYFSNYDETDVFIDIPGNSLICQDREMIDVVEVDGNHVLKYTPSDAVESHSIGALNGAIDNFCFTVDNFNLSNKNWYPWQPTVGGKLLVFFDYEVVTGEKTSHYQFAWQDTTGRWNTVPLSGKGHFSIVLDERNVYSFGINCPASTPDEVEGTYMYIDAIGFGEYYNVALGSASDYALGTNADMTVSFDSKGIAYTVKLDDTVIEVTEDASAQTMTIASSLLEALAAGEHTITVTTVFGTESFGFSVVDNRVSTLRDETVTYSYEAHQPVKVWGTFDDTIEIVSLMQLEKEYDNGYPGGWSFAHNNTGKNYKAYAALTAGQNDEGYITLSTDLLDMLWGTTSFEIEFNNGRKCRFSVEVPDVLMYSDYDNTTIKGWLGGDTNRANTPLSSGFEGNAVIQEDAGGNNLLYILSTEGGEASYFNIRLHSHPWEWYNAFGDGNHYYRVTFDYRISGLDQNSVYFLIMSLASEDKETNFFGSYDEAVFRDGYHEVRFYLNADGETHTFDTGYFTWNGDLRMMRMIMPSFAAADGKYVAVDNFRLYSTETEEDCLTALGNYVVEQSEAFGFTTALGITSVKVDGSDIAYTKDGEVYTLNAAALDALAAGTHKLTVTTAKSRFATTFTVSDNRVAELTETTKNVYYGMGDVKIAGSFDSTLNVTSVTRQGSDDSWDATYTTPGALKTSYVTVEEDGLVLSGTLIDELYGTTTIAVSFDNGKTVSVSLVSNVRYFSNYDETNVFIDIPGNSVICQDREMIDVVEADGNHVLKYTPSNATQGHAVAALNGGWDNFCFTVDNFNLSNKNWYPWQPTVGGKLLVFFDYEVVTGGKTSHYQFTWQDTTGKWNTISLSGKGHFSIVLDERNVYSFGINCPASTPDEVEGTYMYIDAIGFGEYYNVALGSASDYALGTNADMTVSFDSKGLAYTVKLDETVIEVTEDTSAQTMTIASSLLEALAAGEHTITVTTVFGEEKVSFTVTEASSET